MKIATIGSFIPGGLEKMADEASYKIEMLVKDIDKVRGIVHKVQIDLSTMSQKVKDDYAFMFDKIDSLLKSTDKLHDKVEAMREKELKREGFMQGVKAVFTKHPLVTSGLFVLLFFLAQSDFIKNNLLK